MRGVSATVTVGSDESALFRRTQARRAGDRVHAEHNFNRSGDVPQVMDTRVAAGRAGLIVGLCACLAGCGDAERGGHDSQRRSEAVADVRSAAGYRIVGTPIASVTTSPNGITTAVVIVRTNKPVPFGDGRVRANFRLDGASGVSPAIRVGNKTQHCYVQPIDEFPGRAQTGDRTQLTVRLPGVARELRMRLQFIAADEVRMPYKRLCGPRKIFDDPDAGY